MYVEENAQFQVSKPASATSDMCCRCGPDAAVLSSLHALRDSICLVITSCYVSPAAAQSGGEERPQQGRDLPAPSYPPHLCKGAQV